MMSDFRMEDSGSAPGLAKQTNSSSIRIRLFSFDAAHESPESRRT
jgi:hypothetical protein